MTMQYSRKMGLDYGKARIGVAFSVATIASADHIYKTQSEEKDIEYFCNLAKNNKVDEIVIGLPLNADGTVCEMTKVVQDFAEKLAKKSGLKVALQDERLTSFEAEEYLKEAKIKWEKRKELIDKISAQIILQNYLDNPIKKGENNG